MSRRALHDERIRSRLGPLVFVATIFLSACLIFFIQPMVGKRVLPWFGGAPGVWTLCLAFYQSALFAGYAWAHLVIRGMTPRVQLAAQGALVGAALLAPSVLPERAALPETDASPEASILGLLLRHVLLPFMVLASTGPLVQAWFAQRYPERSPYPLYAVSNLGSMLALFVYPFLVEPRLGLLDTGRAWESAFVVVGLLVLSTGALALRSNAHKRAATPTGAPPASRVGAAGPDEGDGAPVSGGQVALWLALSGGAVVILNGLTNRLCLDIASVPFLWILPLATYLLSFVFAFSSDRAYHRGLFFSLALALLVLSVYQLYGSGQSNTDPHSGLTVAFHSLTGIILFYTALLFVVCMILHGELHRLRPPARSLTLFYLCVSGGGALGGLFVGIAAPRLFDGYVEFGVGLALCLLLAGWAAARERGGLGPSWRALGWAPRAALLLGLALVGHEAFLSLRSHPFQIHQERNFFGVLRVLEAGEGPSARRVMMHGTTLHGTQYLKGDWRGTPTSYFGQASPLATVMRTRPLKRSARVGIIGLGAGTIAAYARPGDRFVFYEIDPAVTRLAGESGLFSYLADHAEEVEVRGGDGRLLLEAEQARGDRQDYDILIIDAFSGDAVPVHLLTREAFQIYRRTLARGGVIALHSSNRHFDLMPVIARASAELGLEHLLITSAAAPTWRTNPSAWAFLSESRPRLDLLRRASRDQLSQLGLAPASHQFERRLHAALETIPLWSDDYTDLIGALKADRMESSREPPADQQAR